MKRLIVVLVVLFAIATPVYAEDIQTCSSVYGGGEVCGETTTSSQETTVVNTAVGDNQMIKILSGIAGAAFVATVLYKLTYKSYILG